MLGLSKNPIWTNWACIHFYTVATANPSEGYLAHLGFYTFWYSPNNQSFWRLSGPSGVVYHLCWDCIKTLSGPSWILYIFIQSQQPVLLKAIWPILDFIPPMLGLYKNPIWPILEFIHFYTVPTTSPSKGYLAHLGFYTTHVGTV